LSWHLKHHDNNRERQYYFAAKTRREIGRVNEPLGVNDIEIQIAISSDVTEKYFLAPKLKDLFNKTFYNCF